MNDLSIIGRKVRVIANEFIQTDLSAHIIYASETEKKLLLEMDTPIILSGMTYTHAVASPRLAKDDLDTLIESGALGCSVTWVSKDRFDRNKPFDLSWWRGGAVAVTDVILE